MAETIAAPSSSQQTESNNRQAPRPGDGAFLSGPPQPGDGNYLAGRGAGGSGAPRGRGSRRGGQGQGRGRGEPRPARDAIRAEGSGEPIPGPRRPGQPRKLERADGQNDSQADKGGSSLKTGASGDRLDPSAAIFTPSSALVSNSVSAPQSRDHSPRPRNNRNNNRASRQHHQHQSDGEGSRAPRRPRSDKSRPQTQNAKGPAQSAPSSPGVPKSSRRAAFEKQAKLTTANDADSDDVATASDVEKGQGQGRGQGQPRKGRPEAKSKRKKQDEKDDWVSKLTRGLKSRPFIECPICFNAITPSQPIWSCTPPERPPEPPKSTNININVEEPPPDLSSHYTACYTPFHLTCIRDWANRSLTEEKERFLAFGKEDEEVSWRCPGCQKRRSERVGGYWCFCGRISSPQTNPLAPHSCGDLCSRKRPGCSHPCPLPCHPGPCTPCQVALIVPCPSHHTPLTVKCAVATSNNAALSPVCDEVCGRDRDCGHRYHACEKLCHHGPCSPCALVETVTCYCGKDTKEVSCGWQRNEEKQCAALGEDGEEKHWTGRYSCAKPCEGLYDCGVHPCPETCHPHPLHPPTCPSSPSVVTTCPCGSTPLSQLDAPSRKDCLTPIPTCKNQCPRSRPCGHPCPQLCHAGECPPCHAEVVRPCRCGESMLVVPCDELREKVKSGEDVTCERICKALRNCGRHQCGRVCCPLSWKAKTKKRRGIDDIDLIIDGEDDLHQCHLTCGKLLSCGLHTCTKADHKGSCGRCLEASYDELICHCGRTVVYPPVACGTTINCPYPCVRDAPECGHPKTTHPCHEQPQCPPCPFLTTKPCACGKDQAVKNVRCSQEKVSCGQTCGELLECGYHRCDKKCHRPGECGTCTQICGKPKKICRHPCTAACHAPAKCPEQDSCQAIVTQSCSCGHLRSRTSCGASNANPSSREAVVLKCNSECAVRQRNARLADALGIQPKDKPTEEWAPELKSFATANNGFVKMVEGTFADFFKSPKQTMILPHMPQSKRTFVMSLADAYRLGRELIDQEPNRSVQIRRRIDTRIPTPLLSAAAQPPPPKPSLGGLTNLRTAKISPWGPKPTPTPNSATGTGTTATSEDSSRTTATTSATMSSSSTRVGGLTAAPPPRAASTTPVPALPVQTVAGQVGQVDEDDWADGD